MLLLMYRKIEFWLLSIAIFKFRFVIKVDSGWTWSSKSVWDRDKTGLFLVFAIEVTTPFLFADRTITVPSGTNLDNLLNWFSRSWELNSGVSFISSWLKFI